MDKAEGYGLNEVKQLDQSFRRLVLGFWIPAIVWMFLSGTLAYTLSVKLYKPEHLTQFFGLELSWLTYGRLSGVWYATTIFGWAGSMLLGGGLWIMGRIGGQALSNRLLVGAGALLWQSGIFLGILLVLSGESYGNTLLGMPYEAVLICFIGALFWIWGLVILKIRSNRNFISQDYILGSGFCLIWILSTVLIFAHQAVSGAVTGLLYHWASHGIVYLFLIPMSVGMAYYLMPVLLNRPLRFYGLARLGFWLWIFFACWSGTQGLTGAPLPVWLSGLGSTAAILLVLPITIIALNLLGVLQEKTQVVHEIPLIRFVGIGLAFFVIGGLTHIFGGLANWNNVINLTYFPLGQLILWVYGFVTFIALGLLYYGLPFLTRCRPDSPGLTRLHFWTTFYGTAALAVLMLVAGIVQGVALKNPALDFNQVIDDGVPYFRGRVVALGLLLIAGIAFLLNLMKMRFGEINPKKIWKNREA